MEEEAARACQLEEEAAAREANLRVLQDKASGRSCAVTGWGSRGGVLNGFNRLTKAGGTDCHCTGSRINRIGSREV